MKFGDRESLLFRLSKLGIKAPNPGKANDNVWQSFTALLVPLSRDGRVKDARVLGAKFSKRK